MPARKLSHINSRGEASMVDVTHKPPLFREAVAKGEIRLSPSTLKAIQSLSVAKGNVLSTARLAGIQAAKRTSDLIPLCHPLPLTHVEVEFEVPASSDRILIRATTRVRAGTGVEMEALTAVSLAALTIYDMCKAIDKSMRINGIQLVRKVKHAESRSIQD